MSTPLSHPPVLASPGRRVTARRVFLSAQVVLLASFIGCLVLVPVVQAVDSQLLTSVQHALSSLFGFLLFSDLLVGVGWTFRQLFRLIARNPS
jgi:hypothetical protein